jgi:hypothetical protein
MKNQYIALYKIYLRGRGSTSSQQEKILENANLHLKQDMSVAPPPSPPVVDKVVLALNFPAGPGGGAQLEDSKSMRTTKYSRNLLEEMPVTHSAVLASLVDLETRCFLSDLLLCRCIAEEELRREKQLLKSHAHGGKTSSSASVQNEIQVLVELNRQNMVDMLNQLSTLKEEKEQNRKVELSTHVENGDEVENWRQRTAQHSMFYRSLFPLKGAKIFVEMDELKFELRSSPIGRLNVQTAQKEVEKASPPSPRGLKAFSSGVVSGARARSRSRRSPIVSVTNLPAASSRIILFELSVRKIQVHLMVANRVANAKLEVNSSFSPSLYLSFFLSLPLSISLSLFLSPPPLSLPLLLLCMCSYMCVSMYVCV